MGVSLIPLEMPTFPASGATSSPVLEAEAAAAFDDPHHEYGRDALLAGQARERLAKHVFRIAHFYSAVDYVQAMRARTLAIAEMNKLFSSVDVIVTPSLNSQMTATNLTGHPAIIVPNFGIRGDDAPKPPSD